MPDTHLPLPYSHRKLSVGRTEIICSVYTPNHLHLSTSAYQCLAQKRVAPTAAKYRSVCENALIVPCFIRTSRFKNRLRCGCLCIYPFLQLVCSRLQLLSSVSITIRISELLGPTLYFLTAISKLSEGSQEIQSHARPIFRVNSRITWQQLIYSRHICPV